MPDATEIDCGLKRGDTVRKIAGDYRFEGKVVSLFAKLAGQCRCVVENGDGILHIFSPGQLVKTDPVPAD